MKRSRDDPARPTRDEILRELAERAALPPPEPPPNLNSEEEAAWLHAQIADRRRELGLPPISPAVECPATTPRKLA